MEKMKEIGKGAQRDIYISWDTAVKGAVERYGVVIENYRAGRYPKHEKPQDELLNGIGDLMNVIGTSDARRRDIQDYLAGILAGKNSKTEWLHPFDADVTNAVFQSMKTSFQDWKNELQAETRRRGEKLKNSIEDGLEEFYDIFL